MRCAFGTLLVCALAQAGCASPTPRLRGSHLVYRDASGAPTMQIDYPSVEFCRKVEAIAGRSARCEADSAAAKLSAHAMLRYNPPGMLVEGHYPDVARCLKANSTMAQGVELADPCTAK